MLMQTFLQLMEAQIKKLETQGDVMSEQTKKGGLIEKTAEATVKGADILASGTRSQAYTQLASSIVGVASSVAGMAASAAGHKGLDTSEEDSYRAASNKVDTVDDSLSEPLGAADDYAEAPAPGVTVTMSDKANIDSHIEHLINHPDEYILPKEGIQEEMTFAGRLSKKGKVVKFTTEGHDPKADARARAASGDEREVKNPVTEEKKSVTDILKTIPKDDPRRAQIKAIFRQKADNAERTLRVKRDQVDRMTQTVTSAMDVGKGIAAATGGEVQAAAQSKKGLQDANAQKFQTLMKINDSIITQLQAAEKADQSTADASKQVVQAIMQSAGRG